MLGYYGGYYEECCLVDGTVPNLVEFWYRFGGTFCPRLYGKENFCKFLTDYVVSVFFIRKQGWDII
jgi:hypothetical protein